MVMYSEVLEMAINEHNKSNGTDFKIVETTDDQVIFCTIGVSKYTLADIFNLGHRLSFIEHELRAKGDIEW